MKWVHQNKTQTLIFIAHQELQPQPQCQTGRARQRRLAPIKGNEFLKPKITTK